MNLKRFLSLSCSLLFRPLKRHTPCSLSFLHPYLFIILRLLGELSCQNFSQKGEIILEFDSSRQSSTLSELNEFTCSVSDGSRADSGSTDHLSLLNQRPFSLRAESANDVSKIHTTSPIKIQIDFSKPPLKINQYSISNEAFQGIKPIIEDYRAQGLLTPCTSPCNTPVLSKGQRWRFVQDI